MKRFFRHFAFAAFGVSILCLALGIAMLIWTATAMKWISYGFGAVMILSGILQIASYLTGERVGLLRKLLLISGIIAAVAGVWILLTQSLAEQVMRLTVIVMGVVLLYHGFMDCKHGLDIKSCEAGGWSAALVLGVCICAARDFPCATATVVKRPEMPSSRKPSAAANRSVSFFSKGFTSSSTPAAQMHTPSKSAADQPPASQLLISSPCLQSMKPW